MNDLPQPKPRKKPKKIGLWILEITMILSALVFLFPVFFVSLNAFKTKEGVVLNPTGLPSGSYVKAIEEVLKEKSPEFFQWMQLPPQEISPQFLQTHREKIRDYLGKLAAYDLALETSLKPNFPDFIQWADKQPGVLAKVISGYFGYTWDFETSSPQAFLDWLNPDKKPWDQVLDQKAGNLQRMIFFHGYPVQQFLSAKNLDTLPLKEVRFTSTFSLENFSEAWRLTKFPSVLLNTLVITLFSVLGIVLFASMAAYMMVRTVFKRLGWILFGVFTFAMLIPFQVLMVPLVQLSIDMNLTNLGSLTSGPEWFSSLLNSLGIIPMYWGLGVPFAIFLYHGFIKGVPLSLEESAHMDGAGPFRTFFQVVFPLLTPITATVIILNVLWIWNDFLLPLLILQRGTIQLAQQVFFGEFFKEYGLAMASLVLSALPVVVFYLSLQRFIIKGIAAGAVKG